MDNVTKQRVITGPKIMTSKQVRKRAGYKSYKTVEMKIQGSVHVGMRQVINADWVGPGYLYWLSNNLVQTINEQAMEFDNET